MGKRVRKRVGCLALILFSGTAMALDVNITRDIGQFMVKQGDREVMVMRKQDRDSTIEPDFALTSRPCPPFCAQPMKVANGVETIGEVELVAFMQNQLADGSGVLIDARTPDWNKRGTIPGSINIPYSHLNPGQGADDLTLAESLEQLGVTEAGDGWDFSKAKEVVLWCNGPWCGQSPIAIKGLLSIGYPVAKIRYYRGGIQLWQVFVLTVVYPDGRLKEE